MADPFAAPPGRRLRIVHVSSYQVPGYGYEEIQLAKAQQRLGHEVFIVTSNYLHPKGFYTVLKERFPRRQVEPREENQDGVIVIRLPAFEIGRRVWIRGLERCLGKLAPDVVHCHNLLQFHSMRTALMRARRRGSFALLIDDHMVHSVMRRSLFGRLFYLAYRHLGQPLMARNVDAFCAATLDTRTYLAQECGIRSPIEVRPLGVDVDAFIPSPVVRASWRKRLGLSEEDLVYLYTGKIIAAKGPHLLVEAAMRLWQQGQRLSVLLVGDADPSYLESILARARRVGHGDQVRYHPSVPHPELPGVYAAADVAVWPRQESMALFEAMSTGLPIILTSGSAYSFLAESGAGLTFEPENVEALGVEMRALVSEASRPPMGARGRQLVESGYSWRLSAERYLKSYMDILEQGAPR